MGRTKRGKTVQAQVKGTVTAAEWDDEDNVVEVSICTDEYEEYFVEPEGSGRALFDYLTQDIEAEGTVTEHWDGTKSIRVSRFKPFKRA